MKMRGRLVLGPIALLGTMLVAGCHSNQPVTMAPPVGGATPPPSAGQVTGGQVYNWPDVPQGQQIPVSRASFDQGGYQIYAATGETIVVPFANQNLYVMKFGRSGTGQTYFVNEGTAP